MGGGGRGYLVSISSVKEATLPVCLRLLDSLYFLCEFIRVRAGCSTVGVWTVLCCVSVCVGVVVVFVVAVSGEVCLKR